MKKLTRRLEYRTGKETVALALRWLVASELKKPSVTDRIIRNNARNLTVIVEYDLF